MYTCPVARTSTVWLFSLHKGACPMTNPAFLVLFGACGLRHLVWHIKRNCMTRWLQQVFCSLVCGIPKMDAIGQHVSSSSLAVLLEAHFKEVML